MRVLAVAAHPDDIEFRAAGTMLLLRAAGCDLHYWNLANGCCGSVEFDAATTAAVRLREARNAAARIGATFHPPLVNDLEIFYDKPLLARVGSVMRAVAPDILLVPSPQDYMEDHTNTCRLAVTAAFCRGMPNFPVEPPRPPVAAPVAVYHAQPVGNCDPLNRPVRPDFYVDIGSVIEEKAAMLAEHRSQKDWLERSQGHNAYIDALRESARELGASSGLFACAEGWRRHSPTGFCAPAYDPLFATLAARGLAAAAP